MIKDAWLPLVCSILACLLAWWGTEQTPWKAQIDSPTHSVNRLVAAISGHSRPLASNGAHPTVAASTTGDALALLDLPGVSQKTLGKHWTRLKPSEQDEFMELFSQLLVRIAFPQSAAFFRGLQVEIADERIRGHNATVATYVEHATEGRIDIDYQMVRRNEIWLVRDIQLDGVSLSRNLRGQFQQVIKHDSYAGLLRRMRQKLAQAASPSAS